MQPRLPAMIAKAFSEAAARNGAAIQDVLLREFSGSRAVLEIGSGTGQHAVRFANALGQLTWQCSDLDENLADIGARLEESGLANLPAPLSLDVKTVQSLPTSYDAVYSSNTAHIMSPEAVAAMFALVGTVLQPNGLFCLYGPFRQDGKFNTPSNARFHDYLHEQDAAMGIRDLETLDDIAATSQLSRVRLFAMPANNHIAVWKKGQE